MKTLRDMFDKKYMFGHLVCSASCGIILGAKTLWEAEGMAEVHQALNEIFPDPALRPQLLIYDLACRRRTFLINHPDALSWAGTHLAVDRWKNHGLLWTMCFARDPADGRTVTQQGSVGT